MYQGSRNHTENFFEANKAPMPPSYNPADHYINMVNADFTLLKNANSISPDEWANTFHALVSK